MAVNFNGLSSGIDTAAIIKATIAAQRTPINQLETRKSGYTTQISNLGKIAANLDALKALATDMGKTSNVLAFKIGVGDELVLAATADGESSPAQYEIAVTQLARAEKDRSAAFASPLSQVKAGTLTLQTAGDTAGPYTITIAEGDSLEAVVDKINASGAKVDASILHDGTQSYLQVVAAESGHVLGGVAADAITITESYTGTLGGELMMSEITQAQNALLTIDGLAAETRTNQPNDLVAGIALDLKKIGTSSLAIAADQGGTKTKLEAFVDLTNEVMDLVKSSTRTSDGARKADPDPAIERLATDVRRLITQTIAGVSGSNTSLARIGIQTDASGHLSIDSTKLDKALTADLRGIGRLFTTADTGLSAAVQALATRYTDSIDGVIGNRQKALNHRVDQLDTQIERMQLRLDRVQSRMQRQFTAMEKALQAYQAQGSALSSLYTGYTS